MNLSRVISPEILSSRFILLCVSSVLFMASFNMIIPELPSYLTQMGGANFKGLIISLFATTAALSRPFSGKLADLIGRRPVMIFGALATAVCSAMYPIISGLMGFFILRFIHGLSTGFKPTGTTAFLADVVPDKFRGEALGLLGMSGSVGMAAGPAIGSHIAIHFGTDYMFYFSSFIGFLSLTSVYFLRESVAHTERFDIRMLIIRKNEILEPSVFPSSLVMLLTTYSFGMALTIIPDFSDFLGVKNRGLFFTVMLVASIITRLFSGKASDRIGRERVLLSGTISLMVAMIVLAISQSTLMFFTGALIFGVATGINSPTLFAWTVDLAGTETRGKAIATMFIALELGILSGALISAEIYRNESENFLWAFLSGGCLAAISSVYVFNRLTKR